MRKLENGQDPETLKADKRKREQKRIWGFSYLVGSPLLLGLLYLTLQAWMSAVASSSPAPDQGAMLTAFVILVLGGIVSLIFFVRGAILVTGPVS